MSRENVSTFTPQDHRVAVYGAAFDPPHLGHMDVVAQLLAHFDTVLLVPAASHAFGKDMLPFAHRLRMVHLALAEQGLAGSRISVSEIEEQMLQEQGGRGPVYTYSVLRRLRERADAAGSPESHVFAVGPDNAAPEVWERFWQAERMRAEFGLYVVEERLHLHSTECRALIRECYATPERGLERLHACLGRAVCRYIEGHRLYALE